MEKLYLAGLHYIGFTHKKLHTIFKLKTDYKNVFDNINYDYLKKKNFHDKQIKIILERYKNLNFEFLLKKINERKVEIITIKDKEYPNNLKYIFNPPYLFYLRGNIDNSPKFSIIGSRKISNYGEKVIESIASGLSKYFTIVSGGAAGCDTKAHKEALNNNTKTISVIGTGIDNDYPVGNKKLFDRIADSNGAVVSIFPIGEVGNPHNFPVRNEIVAGLSEGVLVVEAREKSGSLITSKLALDMGKDLFAVPGEIFKWGNTGTNNLIKNGEAKLVSKSSDILEEYNISSKNSEKKQKIIFSDKIEENIYNILLLESLSIDDLSLKMNLKTIDISFKISLLEIKGIICKNLSGKYELK